MTDVDLDGEWYGWRLRGRHLVSADGQRMTVERLRGLMWRDKMELQTPRDLLVLAHNRRCVPTALPQGTPQVTNQVG